MEEVTLVVAVAVAVAVAVTLALAVTVAVAVELLLCTVAEGCQMTLAQVAKPPEEMPKEEEVPVLLDSMIQVATPTRRSLAELHQETKGTLKKLHANQNTVAQL